MKRAISCLLAWSFFWLGDAVSRVMDYWPWERFHPYTVYSRLMGLSCDVQDWGACAGPWSKPA